LLPPKLLPLLPLLPLVIVPLVKPLLLLLLVLRRLPVRRLVRLLVSVLRLVVAFPDRPVLAARALAARELAVRVAARELILHRRFASKCRI
jgi:hypothetical protein